MPLVTQAKYAELKSVSRPAVTQWKKRGRLVMVGRLIDLERTEAYMKKYCRGHSKGINPAVHLLTKPRKTERVGFQTSGKLTGEVNQHGAALAVKKPAAVYADGAQYGGPANLPDEVVEAATAIECGASDLARIVGRHLPMDLVRAIVQEWVAVRRSDYLGVAGKFDGVAQIEWPAPPKGYASWAEHELFTGPEIEVWEWPEIEDAIAAWCAEHGKAVP